MNGSSGDNEIGTPDDLFAWLNRRFRFDYDAFASHLNNLLPVYSTKDGTYTETQAYLPGVDHYVPGTPRLVGPLDGLSIPWNNRRVFWNPPYGRGVFRQAIEKAIEERNNVEASVGLLKYDASTENGRLIRENFHIEYLPRVRYKGMTQGATFASVLAINKPDIWSPSGRKKS